MTSTAEWTNQETSTEWSTAVLELYVTYYDRLVGVACRLLDTPYLAEEAVQESFLKYHTSGACPAPGREYAYLRVITLNTARSMMRRKQCAERWRPETPSVVVAVEDVCIEAFDGDQARMACRWLPLRQRQVVELRYLDELSVADTARHLGISEGSVKTHASRGRLALREHLTSN